MPSFDSLRIRSKRDKSRRKNNDARSLFSSSASLGSSIVRSSTPPLAVVIPPLTPTSSVSSGLSSVLSTPVSAKTGIHLSSLSLEEECQAFEQMELNMDKAMSRKQKQKEAKLKAQMAKNNIPTPIQLEAAMKCRVYTEDGRNVEFGHVIRANWGAPTITVFVRHMWCGLCQEFLRSLRKIDEECYKSQGVEIIVVGCGDPSLIRKYKETAKFDGRMYSDPSGELQERLGMTWRTLDAGSEAEKGEYQQRSMLKNGFMSAANGLRMLNRNPGRFDRLGGEMVFDVEESTDRTLCYYAHRMTNTRSHGPVDKLFAAAGVSLRSKSKGILEELEAEDEGMSCPLYPEA